MENLLPYQSQILRQLHQRWAIFAGLSLAFLFGGYRLLAANWQPPYATRWLLISASVTIYLLIILWRNLDANHRPGETYLLSSLGWGNRLTLLRGVLTAGLLGFLFSPLPRGWLIWIPGILYTLICLADFLDGYLARLTNHTTVLGDKLDMSFDGLGVMGAVILAVQYGQVPTWYLLVGLARYLFLFGLWLRQRAGKETLELPPSISRRVIAGWQMGFIAVMLWPIFSPPGTHIAATLFGIPFLAGFLWDWFISTGTIRSNANSTIHMVSALALRWLPLIVRTVILAVGIIVLTDKTQSFDMNEPTFFFLMVLETITLIFLVLGAAGRIASILALIFLGVNQIFIPLSTFQIMLAVCFTLILFIGSGELSLWTPEDRLIFRRAGEQATTPSRLSLERSP